MSLTSESWIGYYLEDERIEWTRWRCGSERYIFSLRLKMPHRDANLTSRSGNAKLLGVLLVSHIIMRCAFALLSQNLKSGWSWVIVVIKRISVTQNNALMLMQLHTKDHFLALSIIFHLLPLWRLSASFNPQYNIHLVCCKVRQNQSKIFTTFFTSVS